MVRVDVGGGHAQHLAGAHQLVECLHNLLDRRLGVRVVLVVDVDPVGAQAAQAQLARLADARRENARRVGLVVGPRKVLGGDDGLVAVPREGGAEVLLGLAVAVHLSGVEVGDTRVQGGGYHRSARFGVQLHPEVVAPQAQHRQLRASVAELWRPCAPPPTRSRPSPGSVARTSAA